MKALFIDGTSITPKVQFSADTSVLTLEGRSIPENPEDFYQNLIAWLKEYYVSHEDAIEIHFKFEYVNSGSTKFLHELLRLVREFQDRGRSTLIKWYFEEEDEAIQELGEHFSESLMLSMEIIPII